MKKEFLSNLLLCPYCGSDNIFGRHFEGDYDCAWQIVDCDDCDNSWQEVYTFSYRADKDGNPFSWYESSKQGDDNEN